jgi:putative flavoprotein involved in K+ transport
VDLPALAARGVRVHGRLAGIDGTRVQFADDLRTNAASADANLTRLLHRIDDHILATGLQFTVGPAVRPRPFTQESGPTTVDLRAAGIRSVVWATGYRRRYPWLQVPVLDTAGEIRHTAGLTASPGLVVIGQRWQTRRSSTFLDGVRHDARLVVDHLLAGVLAETGRKAS